MKIAKVSDLFQREEIRIAADWWAKTLLSNFTDDCGEFINNAFVAVLKGQRHPWDIPSERNVNRFKECLKCLMAVRFS